MFLEHQISKLESFLMKKKKKEDFLMDPVTLGNGYRKFSYHYNIIKKKTVNLFKILLFLLYFWSNKCSLGDY